MGNLASQFSFGRGGLLPQEEMLEVNIKKQHLIIGIVNETDQNEHRIPLTPQGVALLVNNGYKILFERGAADRAKYSDTIYSEAGAIICDTKEEVYEADILLKVAPFYDKEITLLREKQTIISSFIINDCSKTIINELIRKKVTAIGFEYIHDQEGNYPIVRSMCEIAGSLSIIVAAEYLSNSNVGKGVLLGGVTGISPSEVVILGANTAGEFAARAALGFGAHIKIFDSYQQRLISIQQALGQRVFTSNYHTAALQKALKTAEVVIGAIQLVDDDQNFYVSEEMIKEMKQGSVIVDLSIDQGGCFETSKCTTHHDPIFTKYGVTHYCVPNIASRSARTSSIALSNIMVPILLKMGEHGGLKNYIKQDFSVRQGVYLFNGILTNSYISRRCHLPHTDMDLLMAAF